MELPRWIRFISRIWIVVILKELVRADAVSLQAVLGSLQSHCGLAVLGCVLGGDGRMQVKIFPRRCALKLQGDLSQRSKQKFGWMDQRHTH